MNCKEKVFIEIFSWKFCFILDVWRRIVFLKFHQKYFLIWKNSDVCKIFDYLYVLFSRDSFYFRDISNNLISTIYPDSFAGLKSLNSLYVYLLSSCIISKIFFSILYRNTLKNLPSDVFNELNSLQLLWVSEWVEERHA